MNWSSCSSAFCGAAGGLGGDEALRGPERAGKHGIVDPETRPRRRRGPAHQPVVEVRCPRVLRVPRGPRLLRLHHDVRCRHGRCPVSCGSASPPERSRGGAWARRWEARVGASLGRTGSGHARGAVWRYVRGSGVAPGAPGAHVPSWRPRSSRRPTRRRPTHPPPHRVASCFQTAADPRRGRPSGARCHRQWGGDALGALPPPPPPPMRLASPLRSARLPRRYAARVRVDAPLHSSRRSSDPEACPVIFAYPSVYETVYLGTVYGIVAAENPETLLGHGIPGP